MYENFTLQLSDLTVHAGRFDSLSEGISGLTDGQILDPFSLNLRLERRLVFSLDPLHPNLLLTANVPKLSFALQLDSVT